MALLPKLRVHGRARAGRRWAFLPHENRHLQHLHGVLHLQQQGWLQRSHPHHLRPLPDPPCERGYSRIHRNQNTPLMTSYDSMLQCTFRSTPEFYQTGKFQVLKIYYNSCNTNIHEFQWYQGMFLKLFIKKIALSSTCYSCAMVIGDCFLLMLIFTHSCDIICQLDFIFVETKGHWRS